MKMILLIALFTTAQDYKRGFGDGIAASKSASSSMHMERFGTLAECALAKKTLESMATGTPTSKSKDKYNIAKMHVKCVDLSKK